MKRQRHSFINIGRKKAILRRRAIRKTSGKICTLTALCLITAFGLVFSVGLYCDGFAEWKGWGTITCDEKFSAKSRGAEFVVAASLGNDVLPASWINLLEPYRINTRYLETELSTISAPRIPSVKAEK